MAGLVAIGVCSLVKVRTPDPAAHAAPYLNASLSSTPKDFTNTLGMKFKLIEHGEFLMGSPANEPGRSDVEIQHNVKLLLSRS